MFPYLYHTQANKNKQNRQNNRAGNPSGVNLAALFLCSSDLMHLFIKAQIGLLILTSSKYFENKIIVVQVQLFLKEANDETEMLALISAIKVILQELIKGNVCFFKILLGWIPQSGKYFIHV